MIKNNLSNVSVVLMVIVALTAGSLTPPATAQDEANAGGFELRPGVIVDDARRVVYLMSPQGGIEAVDLGQGRLLWRTDQAAKPLALTGGLLICQVEPSGPGQALEIAALDTRRQGRRTVADAFELPAGVRASIGDTLEGSFTASARASTAEALVDWKFSARRLRGMAPEDPRPPLQGAPPADLPETRDEAPPAPATSGTLRMDLTTGALSALEPGAPATAPPPPEPVEAGGLDLPGRQFVSADGRHVLSSERVADDRVWDKHRWTIYDQATGERVGEVRNYRSQSPFFVSGSRLVYMTGPYLRRTEEGVLDEPLEIQAMDLATGEELWSRPVRDTRYRGPLPP